MKSKIHTGRPLCYYGQDGATLTVIYDAGRLVAICGCPAPMYRAKAARKVTCKNCLRAMAAGKDHGKHMELPTFTTAPEAA